MPSTELGRRLARRAESGYTALVRGWLVGSRSVATPGVTVNLRTTTAVALLTLLLWSVRVVEAQGRSVVRLRAVDPATGLPLRRGDAWLDQQRSARGDSLGQFVFDSVSAGTHQVTIHCTILRRVLWTGAIEAGRDTSTIHVTVDARRCDQRPFVEWRGEFRGYLEAGYEHSLFVPCRPPTSLPRDLAEALGPGTSMWVEYSSSAQGIRWPRGERRPGYDRWYALWRGRIRGPDRFGHMLGTPYLAEVDTVVLVRRPKAGDCS